MVQYIPTRCRQQVHTIRRHLTTRLHSVTYQTAHNCIHSYSAPRNASRPPRDQANLILSVKHRRAVLVLWLFQSARFLRGFVPFLRNICCGAIILRTFSCCQPALWLQFLHRGTERLQHPAIPYFAIPSVAGKHRDLHKFMLQSPSWEANSFSASQ